MNDDNFFSINRLIEFGLGLSVAQQMVKTMNNAISNMNIPGSMNPVQPAPQQLYYAMIDGKQAGPFSDPELFRLIAEKKVVKETYLWKPGLPNWVVAEKLPDVLKLVALSPPPFQQNP